MNREAVHKKALELVKQIHYEPHRTVALASCGHPHCRLVRQILDLTQVTDKPEFKWGPDWVSDDGCWRAATGKCSRCGEEITVNAQDNDLDWWKMRVRVDHHCRKETPCKACNGTGEVAYRKNHPNTWNRGKVFVCSDCSGSPAAGEEL